MESKLDDKNVQMFRQLLKIARPDIHAYMELVDATGVNVRVINSVVRNIANLANGTKFGKVIIEMENGQITFVKGEESDRLFEKAIVPRNSELPPS